MNKTPVRHGVLLVDDEPDSTSSLKRALHKEPYRIRTANSANAALDILAKENLDLIVSDQKMPGMSGLELLTKVSRDYPDTIRIILTGEADMELAIKAINEGCIYRFFTKPCNESDLALTIRQGLVQKDLIAEKKHLQQQLFESEERYTMATSAGNVGVWDWDMETGKVFIASNLKSMLGYDDKEICDGIGECLKLVHPDDIMAVDSIVTEFLNGKIPDYKGEHCLLHRDGSVRWFLIRGTALADKNGVRYRMTGSATDIMELKKLEADLLQAKTRAEKMAQQLQVLSTIDGLTGISNRRHFDKVLNEEWKRAVRNQRQISLLLLDIDYFKAFNDNYGHPAGDECLKLVAGSLKQHTQRPGDLVARYGGEEFVIILPKADFESTAFIAEKVRALIEALNIPHTHSSVSDVVTVSIGVSTMVPQKGAFPASLIAEADKALYAAKDEGRNRIKSITHPNPLDTK